MPRRFKNLSSIEQVIYLPEWFRPYPTKLAPSAVIEGKNEREENFLAGLAERGILTEVAPIPDETAVHLTIGPASPVPGEQIPIFKNVGQREVVFHDGQGAVVASVLPNACITGWAFLAFKRPAGPLRHMNPPPTPIEVLSDKQ
jgi:hypothetical protein